MVVDRLIQQLTNAEEIRQRETVNLIASENYASRAVREALASVFTNKYSEGYPGARYYPGNKHIDTVERLCQKRALELFGLSENAWAINVQPYSGSPANFAVYSAVLGPRDKALGMSLAAGGHLTHGHPVSDSGKFFRFIQYGVDENGFLNYKSLEELTKKYKPKLIVVGASAYARIIDFKKCHAIAKKYEALLMADIAHIAGLIAAGVHPSPFPYVDIVTTTTQKTLRGPRGAMIFIRRKPFMRNFKPNQLVEKINKSVFPGLQGGPHNNTTAGIATALKEAQAPTFKKYARQVVKNAQVLAQELQKRGFQIVTGGTDTHLFLVDLRSKKMSGGIAEKLLEKNGITANRNAIPYDPRKPFDPSGIRIGTPAVTTRGMKEKEMAHLAKLIDGALQGKNVSQEVKKVALPFPIP